MILDAKDISIIMPCYNTKLVYLQEAINSVLAYSGNFSYEVIIIDDGSTDHESINWLKSVQIDNVILIDQSNAGPSSARNLGVEHANGEFLLCLDSDNKLKPEYIDKGVYALRRNQKAAVAYGKPDFIFESDHAGFNTGPFSVERLLVESYIDMCAVIRKQAWNQVGGLELSLNQFEDWEFWIRLCKANWEFIFLDEILFQYRVREQSLMDRSGTDNFKKMVEYIYTMHWDFIYKIYHSLYSKKIIYDNDVQRPLRSFLKYSKEKFLK